MVFSMISNFLSSFEYKYPIDVEGMILDCVFHIVTAGFVEGCAAVVGCDTITIESIDYDVRMQSLLTVFHSVSSLTYVSYFFPKPIFAPSES